MQSNATNTKKPALNEANIKLIGKIKKELKEVSVNDVCAILGYSRQNLYQHLGKKNIDTIAKANFLMAIHKAIQTVKSNYSSAAAEKAAELNTIL